MKTCPLCKTVYADDTLNFCLDDGASLFQGDGSQPPEYLANLPADSPETEIITRVAKAQSFSAAQNTPETTPSFTPTFQNHPQNTFSNPQPANSNFKIIAIIGGTLCVGIIGGLLIAFGLGGAKSADNTYAKYNTTAQNTSNSAVVTNAPVSNYSSNINLVNMSNYNPSANAAPIDTSYSLKGNWKGKFGSGSMSSELKIQQQDGEKFTGTFHRVDGFVIEIRGKIDYQNLTISWTETKVIKKPKDNAWFLGKNDGTISKDGKTIQGKGTDTAGSAYSWSFTKE